MKIDLDRENKNEKKYERMKRNQVDTGVKDNHWLESKKIKDSLMQQLKRQSWTWRKSL